MRRRRLVIAHATEAFKTAVSECQCPLFQGAEFCAKQMFPADRTALIAHDPEHLATYEAWFPGLTVRVNGRLRAAPLGPMEALYLPVTYDSWVIFVNDASALPSAMEAARLLHCIDLVICPTFAEDVLPTLQHPPRTFQRHGDRVWPDA
jgi:hypothetical protein